jgi:hypothetical protein
MWVSRSEENAEAWSGLDSRMIQYRSDDARPRELVFEPAGPADYFADTCAYNHGPSNATVGDVRLRGEVTPIAGDGWIELRIARNDDVFTVRLSQDGGATLSQRNVGDMIDSGVQEARVSPLRPGVPVGLSLEHVDYRVVFSIDGREVLHTSDADYRPDMIALRRGVTTNFVRVSLTAAGLDLNLRKLRLDRDVYYTYRDKFTLRAYAGSPFQLGPDEYFVLGDNSPQSHDSREWFTHGVFLPDTYRDGTVLADQIVGRAFFVYLPGLLPLDHEGRWHVPDLGRVRFIR